MAASVNRFAPVVRGEGKIAPQLIPMANWIDNLVLVANVAQTYTLPTGTDLSGGGSEGANPSTPPGVLRTATILRVSTNGALVYINAQAAASVPAANNIVGNGSIPIAGGQYMLQIPVSVASVSFIASGAAVISIEAWW